MATTKLPETTWFRKRLSELTANEQREMMQYIRQNPAVGPVPPWAHGSTIGATEQQTTIDTEKLRKLIEDSQQRGGVQMPSRPEWWNTYGSFKRNPEPWEAAMEQLHKRMSNVEDATIGFLKWIYEVHPELKEQYQLSQLVGKRLDEANAGSNNAG